MAGSLNRKHLFQIVGLAMLALALGAFRVGFHQGERVASWRRASVAMVVDLEIARGLRRLDTATLRIAEDTLRNHLMTHCVGRSTLFEWPFSPISQTFSDEARASIRDYWKNAQAEEHWDTPYGNEVPPDEVEVLDRCLNSNVTKKE